MIVCTDLRPGRGVTIIDPGAEPVPVTKDVAPTPGATPDGEPAPEATDTAVASATDQDADNAPDELEPGLGLDPTNPDTDGDGVADGDEPNLYGTDPLNRDTDGDSVSDFADTCARVVNLDQQPVNDVCSLRRIRFDTVLQLIY